MQRIDQLSAAYRDHPLLPQSAHPAQLRLDVLYYLRDKLRRLQGALAEQEPTSSFFGFEQEPAAPLRFSKKWRQHLRQSLLGEA